MITSSFLSTAKYGKSLNKQWSRFNSFRDNNSGFWLQLTLNSIPGQLVRYSLICMVFAYAMFNHPGDALINVFVAMLTLFSVTFYSFLYQQLRQVSLFSTEKCDKNILSVYG